MKLNYDGCLSCVDAADDDVNIVIGDFVLWVYLWHCKSQNIVYVLRCMCCAHHPRNLQVYYVGHTGQTIQRRTTSNRSKNNNEFFRHFKEKHPGVKLLHHIEIYIVSNERFEVAWERAVEERRIRHLMLDAANIVNRDDPGKVTILFKKD